TPAVPSIATIRVAEGADRCTANSRPNRPSSATRPANPVTAGGSWAGTLPAAPPPGPFQQPTGRRARAVQRPIQALCVPRDKLPGYGMLIATTNYSSAPYEITAAGCPSGTRAIGGGASVDNPDGHVGLQLSRLAGGLDLARASGRADDGYTGVWRVK